MIGVYFPASPMTDEQYHSLDDKLRSAIGGPIAGMMLHTCFREGDALAVFDVWESREAFEALGATLAPLAQELGVVMSPPQFVEMLAFDVP